MEKRSAFNTRQVKLENLFDEKIIIEDSEKLTESVFDSIYKKADSLVESIQAVSKDKDNEQRQQEELQIVNTISFEGRRGTGKTSAMMSYCNKLRKKPESYIVLDYIDASALEQGESILEIVLANIYHKLSESLEKQSKIAQYGYETRNIIRELEMIYSGISFINDRRNRNGRSTDLSPLSGLERLSNSQQLKKEVYKLICKFKRLIASDNALLVIPIDDIDMCFQNEELSVYEVMETLHRYLMIPNVVIFLTYDYPELLSGCEKHFSQMLYTKNCVSDSQRNHIQKVSNRYLEKVLPTYARIHMPSQQKRDYSDQNIIQVCLKSHETATYLKAFSNLNDNVNLNPKQFALLFKASNCGLFYDSQGKKRHYAEPSDFRDMVHIVTMCKQLCGYYNKDTEEGDEFVFKELLDDLYFRFARIHLSESEKEYNQYTEYLKVNIERRSKDILRDIWKTLRDLEKEGRYHDGYSKIEDDDSNKKRSNVNNSYSYGELLYGLYRASSSSAFSKSLICCILDSYTIMLTKLYRAVKRKEKYIKDYPDDVAYEYLIKDRNYTSIKSIIGPSISSSWSYYYVPRIIQHVSIRQNEYLNTKDGAVPSEPRKTGIGAFKFIDSNQYYKNPRKWELEIDQDDNNKCNILHTVEILCMFFTDVKGGFVINYNNGGTDSDVKTNNDEVLRGFKFEFAGACFNILNFVNNLFCGEEFFKEIHSKLDKALDAFLEKDNVDKREWLKENSLYKDFVEWKSKYGRCVMPIYSFDMMYNIMKRQYLDTLEKKPYINEEEVTEEEFLTRLLEVYDNLLSALRKQDMFYYTNKDADEEIKEESYIENGPFASAFAECPFIKYMSEIKTAIAKDPQDRRIKYLQKFFRNISFSYRL